jgi:hypothetical protein
MGMSTIREELKKEGYSQEGKYVYKNEKTKFVQENMTLPKDKILAPQTDSVALAPKKLKGGNPPKVKP